MSKRIVTISRQFGSGGRDIGRLVAQALNIPFYDKELIEKIAEETGFDKKFVELQSEYAPSKTMFSYALVGRGMDGMSTYDYVWSKQRSVILSLAEQGPCVIVGRCADFILRDRDDVFDAFIHAGTEYRIKRMVEKYGIKTEKPEKFLNDIDKKREINYRYYTDRRWGMSQNYDISLDSEVIGVEKCAGIIIDLVKTV